MEENPQSEATFATTDEIRAAIKGLSKEDTYRLVRAGRSFRFGTEFREPKEIMHEAMMRAMRGSRRWCRQNVPFVAFLIETMWSITDASRKSPEQARTKFLDVSVMEGGLAAGALWVAVVASPEEIYLDSEYQAERQSNAVMAVEKILQYFEKDGEVQSLISCLGDGRVGREIRAELSWTETKYETVRKRLRRGLAKLFRSRRPL